MRTCLLVFAVNLMLVFTVSSQSINYDTFFPLVPQMFGAKTNKKGFDNTLALQQWIDSLGKSSRIGYLPEGDYYIKGTIYLDKSNLKIYGSGAEKSIIKADSSMEAVIRIVALGQNISGIGIDANDNAHYGMLMLRGAYSTFREGIVKNAMLDGIYLPGKEAYTSKSSDWTKRDTITADGIKDKHVFNDPIIWEEWSVSGCGITYYSNKKDLRTEGRNINNSVHYKNIIAKIKYNSKDSVVVVNGWNLFNSKTTPTNPRKGDLIKVKSVLSTNSSQYGKIPIASKASAKKGSFRISFSQSNLRDFGIRRGDKLYILRPAKIDTFNIKYVNREGWVEIFYPILNGFDSLDYEIETEHIFTIARIVDSITAKVMALNVQKYGSWLNYDLPDRDFIVTVGDGVREDNASDNQVNIWIGGNYTGNAGSGRFFRSTFGHNLIGGLSHYNNGYGLIIGSFEGGSPSMHNLVDKLYTEANACGSVYIGSVQGTVINSLHTGNYDRAAIEVLGDGTNSMFIYSGESNFHGMQISRDYGGITIGEYNFNLNAEGIPYLDDFGRSKYPIIPKRGKIITFDIGIRRKAVVDTLITIALPKAWISEEIIMEQKYKPSVSLIGEKGPVGLLGIYGIVIDKDTNPISIKFRVKIKNLSSSVQNVSLYSEIQFYGY